MRILFCAWLMALMICTAIDAREQTTVLVYRTNADGSRNQGSGVICGGTANNSHRVILTAEHVVGPPGSRVIVTADPKREVWHRGTVVGSDDASDAALVVIRGDYLERVPNALLWHGKINGRQTYRVEGFASGNYRETTGRLIPVRYSHPPGAISVAAAADSGMSGGPVYVEGHRPPRVLFTVTGSDGQMTVGPYRSHLKRFVETCATSSHGFRMDNGAINMIPLAPVPTVPDDDFEGEDASLRPRETQAKNNADLQTLLKDLLSQAKPKADIVPEVEPEVEAARPKIDPAIADQDVIEIPIVIRIKRQQTVELEVMQ